MLNILSVAALNQYDSLAGYSNYGLANVDIAAPGSNIISSVPTINSSNPIVEIDVAGLIFSNPQIIEYSGVNRIRRSKRKHSLLRLRLYQ